LGAELLRMKLGFDAIFGLLAIPAFLAATALVIKHLGVKSTAPSGTDNSKAFVSH
ncbi:MAG: aromatic acid/H+ symport family MFS transporter, partial [Cupriavidus sp.]